MSSPINGTRGLGRPDRDRRPWRACSLWSAWPATAPVSWLRSGRSTWSSAMRQGIRIGSSGAGGRARHGQRGRCRPGGGRGNAPRPRADLAAGVALVKKLRQDVKVSIVPALTGMSHVNIVVDRPIGVALVPGQSIPGVETSFFDPIIEQVGSGPRRAQAMSHTIADVRQTVDSLAPRLRQMLGSLQETTTNLREMSDSIRPRRRIDRRPCRGPDPKLNDNSPRIESHHQDSTEDLAGQAQGYLADNRENVKQTHGLSPRPDSPRSMTSWSRIASRSSECSTAWKYHEPAQTACFTRPTRSPANCESPGPQPVRKIERSVTNVRDATDWANKLVQKIYTNPFVLSPFYKPNPRRPAGAGRLRHRAGFHQGGPGAT